MIAIIDADRISFNNGKLFYHKCDVIESPTQSKLRTFINNRSDDKVRAVNEAAHKCKFDDNEYPDGLFD